MPIPCSMRLRDLVPRLRDLTLSARDLSLAGLLVAPIWLALGIAAGDLVMVGAAIAVAMVSTVSLLPGLAAWLRDVSAALPQQPLLRRVLPRALVLLRARA
jgi:hypothetical protein